MEKYDCVIFGAGIYGLYAADFLSSRGARVAVLEYDPEPFSRASFVNQARVHNGYHYPRSISTAAKSASYFERFTNDFSFAVNSEFKKIYAISSQFTLTNSAQFIKFCKDTGIEYSQIHPSEYFNSGVVEDVFATKEYSFCAKKIKDYYLKRLEKNNHCDIYFNSRIKMIEESENYFIELDGDVKISVFNIINATYASTNQILKRFSMKDMFKLKYELCEVILCEVGGKLKDVGLTVMDGPFFSVMPFGFNIHSLTSVTYTPVKSCLENEPRFDCQKLNSSCSPRQLSNCNICPNVPSTAWPHMYQLCKKFLKDAESIKRSRSLYGVKTILASSELDDSRHTVIRQHSKSPRFYSVLSGKINTVYDLDEILEECL